MTTVDLETNGFLRTMPCARYRAAGWTRRGMLAHCGSGFGLTALAAMTAKQTPADAPTHHHATARRVIFLYMDGGPSQIDTFDPKPELDRVHGRDPAEFFSVRPTQFDNNGTMLRSPWKFTRHGQSGTPVSELFPHIAKLVDKLAVIRSMTSEFSEHTFANYFLHTGSGLVGRPCMGAWVHYGLGSENESLPGFIAINGGLVPPGGLDCFSNGFLDADHQGSIFVPRGTGVANVHTSEPVTTRRDKLRLIADLDAAQLAAEGSTPAIETAIRNYELAASMQMAVPELMSLSDEPDWLRRDYGLESGFEPTRIYAAQCMLARRMIERGVRFVELTCPQVRGDRWDQHSNLKEGHERNALAVDQPIAMLLSDLQQRGLLDDTLVVWAGEFGRTPFAQGANGRDHNPDGFSIWMAGGGVRGGMIHGETDPFGYRAIAGRMEIHDLHATMLHLLGLDHERLAVRYGGRDMRLTDVKGRVVRELIDV